MYKSDGPQAAIKAALVAAGCSVALIEGANHAAGVPDLLVGKDGRNVLLEVKAAKGRLSPAQERWHGAWRGMVVVVKTVEEALRAVGIKC